MGCRFKAMGVLVFTWDLAQKWFLKSPHGTIPEEEWRKANIPDVVIITGFVKRLESGLYVCGSEEQFKWLLQRQAAGRGNIGKKLKRPSTGVNGSLSSSSSSSSGKGKEEDSPERSFEHSRTAIAELYQFSELFKQRGVSLEAQTGFLKAFPDLTWLIAEINKAVAWELANPTRRKKRFAAFLQRWFTKGWDQRKTIAAQKQVNRNIWDFPNG